MKGKNYENWESFLRSAQSQLHQLETQYCVTWSRWKFSIRETKFFYHRRLSTANNILGVSLTDPWLSNLKQIKRSRKLSETWFWWTRAGEFCNEVKILLGKLTSALLLLNLIPQILSCHIETVRLFIDSILKGKQIFPSLAAGEKRNFPNFFHHFFMAVWNYVCRLKFAVNPSLSRRLQ